MAISCLLVMLCECMNRAVFLAFLSTTSNDSSSRPCMRDAAGGTRKCCAFYSEFMLRPCLDHRIFKGVLKESAFQCVVSCSSVWNKGFATSFPEENFLHYVLEENKNLLRSLGFFPFTKSETISCSEASLLLMLCQPRPTQVASTAATFIR
jgi:hypothetical protein